MSVRGGEPEGLAAKPGGSGTGSGTQQGSNAQPSCPWNLWKSGRCVVTRWAHTLHCSVLFFCPRQKCDVSKHKVLVASICPQSLPFFAVKFGVDITEAAHKLCGFLKHLGECLTVHINWLNCPRAQSDAFRLFIFPPNSPKPKDSSFTSLNDKENHQILALKKQEEANVWHFWLENDWSNE